MVTELQIEKSNGKPVCAKECARLPAQASTLLLAKVTTIPSRTGPAVPVGALVTHPDGAVTLSEVAKDGSYIEREVRVIASQDGLAVVGGIDAGSRVLLPDSPSGDGQ